MSLLPNTPGGGIIWREGSIQAGAVGVALNDTAPTFWLMPGKDSRDRSSFFTLSWEKYLMKKLFFFAEDPENPLRTSPSDTSEVLSIDKKGYRLFSVTAVRLPWIQVNRLLEKNGTNGSDKWSKPLGWTKWYCDGEEQVKFLNPYQIENFYAQ